MKTLLLASFIAACFAAHSAAAEEPTRSISGTVRDRDGKPVAAARVFALDADNEWETKTGDAGDFTLDKLPAEGAFLFIEADGFRFHGIPLAAGKVNPDLQLARIGQPATDPLTGKDWLLSRDERLELIRRVFDPYLERMLASEKDVDKLRPIEFLAQIDPPRALEILEQKPFKQQQMNSSARGRVVEQLARIDTEAAIELAESFDGAYIRAFCFWRITSLAPALSKPDRIALLSRAAADAKSIKNPAQRIALLGLVAEGLLDSGERATAEKLLRETHVEAEKVAGAAWAGFARGAFAEEMAQIDSAAALALVKELKDESERIRHLGNMAHELAVIDPAEAQRVLDMIERPRGSRQVVHERDDYAIRVCYRMAVNDLPRAEALALTCHEKNFQAYALGLIAHAIAEDKPAQAETLLRRACELLKEGIRGPQTVKVHSAQIAGCLLPTAERIDPSLVRELVWRSVSLRTPRDQSDQYRAWSDQQTSQLACWISRHDRHTARLLLDHWHSGNEMQYGRDQYSVALALIDPERAVEFSESQDKDGQLSRSRLSVARALAAEGDARVRIPHREAGLWPIDVEDAFW